MMEKQLETKICFEFLYERWPYCFIIFDCNKELIPDCGCSYKERTFTYIDLSFRKEMCWLINQSIDNLNWLLTRVSVKPFALMRIALNLVSKDLSATNPI